MRTLTGVEHSQTKAAGPKGKGHHPLDLSFSSLLELEASPLQISGYLHDDVVCKTQEIVQAHKYGLKCVSIQEIPERKDGSFINIASGGSFISVVGVFMLSM